MPWATIRFLLVLGALELPSLAFDTALLAQPASTTRWTARSRVFVSGGSHRSEPAGYQAYSGLGLEFALGHRLTPRFGASLSIRTESREIDSLGTSGTSRRLGSIEFLPVTVLIDYRLATGGGIRPYVGAGGTVTVAWEKTGVLDSLDVKASLGPAIAAGVDVPLAATVWLTFEARWNVHRFGVGSGPTRLMSLDIDPLVLGAGLAVSF